MTPTTCHREHPTIVLIAGHWLGAWAFDEVTERLAANGIHAVPITLPGLEARNPNRTRATLGDQASAIANIVLSLAGDVVIAAHSGANAPVSIFLDQYPQAVTRVIWVDSGPVSSGSVYAPDLPPEVTEVPLPPFEELGTYASLEGLSAADLDRFRSRAVPQPGPVMREPVHLTNAARLAVPTTLVCCSIRSEHLLALAEQGHPMFTEVHHLEDVETIDLPTGHWPMWSRSHDLARVLITASKRAC